MTMEKIEYERNWCEYFTRCPYKFDEKRDEPYVGDYACCSCRFNKKVEKESAIPDGGPSDYSKYFKNVTGRVTCAFKDSDYYQQQMMEE